LQYPFQIQKWRISRKAQHRKALRTEKCIPHSIVFLLLGMLRAIHFNNQLRIQTRKVRDIAAQRMLAAEFDAQLLTAQARPKTALSVGHGSAQVTGE